MLGLLFLLAGTLPGAGFLPATPLAAPMVVQGAASDEFDEFNDRVLARPTLEPAPSPAPAQLILAELNRRGRPSRWAR